MSIGFASDRGVNSKQVPLSKPTYVAPDNVNSWTRPTDWLTLPTITNTDNKLVGLYGVVDNSSNFAAFTISVNSGTYTVDWGDGTVENIASGTQANHLYDYTTLSSTVTSDGYKQAIIQIYPTTAGSYFTNINLQVKYSNGSLIFGTLNAYTTNWFDIAVSAPSCSGFTVGGSTVYHGKVQQFKVLSTGAIGGFDFTNFFNLRNVELDFSGTTSMNMQNMFYNCYSLEVVPNIQWDKCNNAFQMFYQCYSLKYVPDATTNMSSGWTTGVTRYMFYNCYSLRKAPWLDTSKSTSCQNMFFNCNSLIDVPQYDFTLSTAFNSMFESCLALKYVPYFKTSVVTTTARMFYGCVQLQTVAGFDVSQVTDFTNMFGNCYSLTEVPALNTTKGITFTSMFQNCYALVNIPMMDTGNATAMNSMFAACDSLYEVPLLNTSKVTNMNGMFQGAQTISIPTFDTANVTDMTNMFNGNRSLKVAPSFNTSKVTAMTSMFAFTYGIQSIPNYDTGNVTLMNSMFQDADGLIAAPTLNTVKVTNMSSMFQNCKRITTIPTYDTGNVTNMSSMFNGCESLEYLPVLNTPKVTDFSNFITNTRPLEVLPALNMANTTTIGTLVGTSNGLGSILSTGMKVSFSVASQKLGKTELETMFNNMATSSAQTVTISSNWGADTAVNKASTWTGSSTTMSVTDATSLVVGMWIYGTNMVGTASCSFDATSDYVSVTGKTFNNGTPVGFTSIVTTTGIVVNQTYYVVNSIGSTFKLSATVGGTPIDLVTNGTGTIRWGVQITNIVGTTLTLSATPAGAGTGSTLSYRRLNTNIATFKNWTVTG